MSVETIVRHCSPTLAGMKTGSLFCCFYDTREEMTENIRFFDAILEKKGVRMIPLKYENKRALVYVFRISQLRRDLSDEAVSSLLKSRGYEMVTSDLCIGQLMSRLQSQEEFPHEIGLFLGYPPEDVAGFLEGVRTCKYKGTWKVYSDVDKAKKLFARYQKCTNVYRLQLSKGSTIEKLTVSC